MIIQKEDLVLTHYNWPAEEVIAREDSAPTRRTFDRDNGVQIIWIANWFAAENNTFQKNDMARLEAMISDELPFTPLSEKTASEWLLHAWH